VIAIDDRTDHHVLRTAFGCFPSGVTVVAALSAESPVGMTVSSFTSVSFDPPLVSICVRRSSTTWARLRPAGAIGVSVLGAHQADVCRALAAPGDDRFTAGCDGQFDAPSCPAGALRSLDPPRAAERTIQTHRRGPRRSCGGG